MTPEEVRLVRSTSDVFLAVNTRVADRFYDRLFEIEPGVRALFPADLHRLKLKLMNTLATVVGSLDRPDMFRSILLQIGQQHGQLGIRDQHYEAGRVALMDGLELALGARFTAAVRDAWHVAYGEVQATMTASVGREGDVLPKRGP
ncbi:MAG: hemin receptor [Parafilimonas terrae]|nr:hemin receptor [Parafilimonas terrae]